MGKLLELMGGRTRKASFYEKMYYFGYHRFQLGLFGRKRYNQTYQMLRRPYVVPLATLALLDELALSYPSGLLAPHSKPHTEAVDTEHLCE